MDGSPEPPYLAKTSSSEWNSSDDLAGPFSEQDDPLPPPPPPLPPKDFIRWPSDFPGLGGDADRRRDSPSPPPPPLLSTTHPTFRRWMEATPDHRHSSDSSSAGSKSVSSDQERNDLSASDSEKGFSGDGDAAAAAATTSSNVKLPTTYFSVDGCMTDTYRAKYHRRPPLHAVTEAWGEQQQASSGESDADSRRLPTVERRVPEPGRGRSELGKHSEKCTLEKFRKKFVNAFLYSPVGLLLNFLFLMFGKNLIAMREKKIFCNI